MVEEVRQRFAALGSFRQSVGELVQIVGAGGVFARIPIHEHVQIAAVNQNRLQEIRR